ncbi:serine/threonine-protein phosphatase 7 long form [Dorcoceras hygrometricum]|uniref:Serine/threonine-protein phosphatase 7 long form n=1 Tax=Dorcoceras hygrometricum TaxID=472368 RepID=A0A2Z7C147_9LAMI|nr:serine/threonine-protein phosphatase 7 long form [Dorcoceras hygrometricum]
MPSGCGTEWTAYRSNDIDVKTIIDSYDNKIRRCVCPLMRQFKLRQSIPVPALDNDSLHNVTRIGHRNTDWKSYHRDAIRLWNRKFRLLVDGEEHGRSRQTDDDYMSCTPSLDSHQSSAGPAGYGDQYDVFASHQSFAGQSGNVDLYGVFASHQSSVGPSAPSYVYDTMMTLVPSSVVNTVASSHYPCPVNFALFYLLSCTHTKQDNSRINSDEKQSQYNQQSLLGPSTGQHLTPEHDTLPSFVDQGYQTLIWSNVQSFTDLLNVNHQQNVHDHTERNIITPIPFPSYSGEQNIAAEDDTSVSSEHNLGDENVELGRGRRRRRPTKCGTSHHLYYRMLY